MSMDNFGALDAFLAGCRSTSPQAKPAAPSPLAKVPIQFGFKLIPGNSAFGQKSFVPKIAQRRSANFEVDAGAVAGYGAQILPYCLMQGIDLISS